MLTFSSSILGNSLGACHWAGPIARSSCLFPHICTGPTVAPWTGSCEQDDNCRREWWEKSALHQQLSYGSLSVKVSQIWGKRSPKLPLMWRMQRVACIVDSSKCWRFGSQSLPKQKKIGFWLETIGSGLEKFPAVFYVFFFSFFSEN